MPEFELAGLDYESAEESANVVNVERPRSESPKPMTNPADRESDRKDLIESETQDSKTEGKRPEESPRG